MGKIIKKDGIIWLEEKQNELHTKLIMIGGYEEKPKQKKEKVKKDE